MQRCTQVTVVDCQASVESLDTSDKSSYKSSLANHKQATNIYFQPSLSN